MPRLTNSARERIAAMILDHKFKAPEAAFDKRQLALGLEAYNRLYTPAQRRLMAELVASTKARALYHIKQFDVNAGGWRVKLKLAVEAPVLEAHESGWNPILDLPADDALGAKLQQYATERKAHDDARSKLGEQVSAQLRPHYTFDRLTAAWPEIERFASAVERGLTAPASLPAPVDHKALNAALDLPPELEKAA